MKLSLLANEKNQQNRFVSCEGNWVVAGGVDRKLTTQVKVSKLLQWLNYIFLNQ